MNPSPVKLKAYLVLEKIKQRDLAKKIKIHYTRINLYLNGFLNFTENDIKKICKCLDLDFQEYRKGNIKKIGDNK
jgi:transcriptional regulator with XRE-family HTH domain